jgi:hypothetical protein
LNISFITVITHEGLRYIIMGYPMSYPHTF